MDEEIHYSQAGLTQSRSQDFEISPIKKITTFAYFTTTQLTTLNSHRQINNKINSSF
jgi:hypothetical protein